MIPMVWRPFGDLGEVRERMDRLFDDVFTRFGREVPVIEFFRGAWTPPADILETEKEVVVRVDLPGMTREEINLELKENVLIIRGERKSPQDAPRENYLKLERASGKFERSLTLPQEVDADKATAGFDKGILKITLPKTARSLKKRISIQ